MTKDIIGTYRGAYTSVSNITGGTGFEPAVTSNGSFKIFVAYQNSLHHIPKATVQLLNETANNIKLT